jgi:hypothetical protein
MIQNKSHKKILIAALKKYFKKEEYVIQETNNLITVIIKLPCKDIFVLKTNTFKPFGYSFEHLTVFKDEIYFNFFEVSNE